MDELYQPSQKQLELCCCSSHTSSIEIGLVLLFHKKVRLSSSFLRLSLSRYISRSFIYVAGIFTIDSTKCLVTLWGSSSHVHENSTSERTGVQYQIYYMSCHFLVKRQTVHYILLTIIIIIIPTSFSLLYCVHPTNCSYLMFLSALIATNTLVYLLRSSWSSISSTILNAVFFLRQI